jgi:Ser-tRNA(Ala) deacylase AlaX
MHPSPFLFPSYTAYDNKHQGQIYGSRAVTKCVIKKACFIPKHTFHADAKVVHFRDETAVKGDVVEESPVAASPDGDGADRSRAAHVHTAQHLTNTQLCTQLSAVVLWETGVIVQTHRHWVLRATVAHLCYHGDITLTHRKKCLG